MCKEKSILLLSIFMLSVVIPLSAQVKQKGLIFSEVFFNEKQPERSWIEIYNPTSNSVILEGFRFSHILTTNMLPKDIMKNGGVEVPSKKCILLCSDELVLGTPINANCKVIQLEAIKNFYKGGFIALRTKGFDDNGVDIIRYGEPELTSEL